MASPVSFSKAQIIVLLVCVSLFALGQFHRASGAVFTPILMDRYAVSAATLAGLVSAMFLANIVVQVPFGIALDRFGPRPVLTACVLTIALGTLIFALAQSFEASVLARILMGIGMASMAASQHIIIARNFKARDFGYISGLVVTLGGFGGLLGTYPLAFALERATWSVVFGGVALATFALALGVLRAVQPGAAAPEKDAPSGGFGALLRDAEFRKILVLGTVTYGPITTITGLWGGPYLQDVLGFSSEGAGLVLLVLFGSTIVAGTVFGQMDRRMASRKRVVLGAVLVSSTAFALLALVPGVPASVAIALLLAAVFAQQFYIPLGAHMRKVVPDHMLGRASTLLALCSVAAIPVLQVGFGAILDFGAARGVEAAGQFRMAFAALGAVIFACGLIYATAKDVDEAP